MEKRSVKRVDEGFELFYFKLSHKRKLIRTIWITLIGMILIPVIYFFIRNNPIPLFSSWKCILLWDAVILMIGFIQAVCEYRKWKTEKESIGRNGKAK